jgi:hypothetical protein
MTTQHFLYIPIVFLLGMVFGTMLPRQVTAQSETGDPALRKRLFQSVVVFILIFVVTHVLEIPGGAKSVTRHLGGSELFDRRPSFTASEVYERIEAFSDYGIIAYKRFTYTIDILFPLTFLFFLFNFARYISYRASLPKSIVTVLMYLPFAWFLSDMAENAIILGLLSILPNQNHLFGSALGTITVVKFLLVVLSISMPTLLLIGQLLIRKNSGMV